MNRWCAVVCVDSMLSRIDLLCVAHDHANGGNPGQARCGDARGVAAGGGQKAIKGT